MSETVFSKIIRREIPATVVYEDSDILGFQDIAPSAPIHILFIPKNVVIPRLHDATIEQAPLLGKLLLAAAGYAKSQGFSEDGYRVVINCNGHGGQTVFHLHLHLLAGTPLGGFADAEMPTHTH